MAKYKYLITDKYGKEKKGTMEAVSEEAAMRKLKGEGSIVLELSEAFDLDNQLEYYDWKSGQKKGYHHFL